MNTHLSREPKNISKICWYYEDEKGLDFCYEVRKKNGDYIRTYHFLVPWRKILASVGRYQKGKKQ